ncbi:DNA-(apurinic or apyrimidinic site) lyase 2-like [Centruroides sculpturatus]|uniref:DNA-(apurinic or apyrimidinic site) lyase 2-like n=1 Tax=Centruroides sculpturatus TaxID=218467 RepID=UPI000C6E45C6|nr:DNA-(apurinic or apyrimidinic site) lyase 2-like [Centruroides sculpturatus]
MKIVSWNVNGLRSLKSSIKDILKNLDADILCLQETKLSRNQLEESLAFIEGYNSYFAFPRHLSGYSGVATYCKDSCKPVNAAEGLSGIFSPNTKFCLQTELFTPSEMISLDGEGRAIVTEHLIKCSEREEKLAVINVYCPRADPNKLDRKDFKLKFNQLLHCKTELLLKNCYHVLIVGDLNITHKPIDHCDPGSEEEFLNEPSRQWLDSFILSSENDLKSKKDMIDTFRHLNPTVKNAYTCWNSKTSARLTNYGTRIDYVLTDKGLLPYLKESIILSDIKGSDHCPIAAVFKFSLLSNKQCPDLCTRYWPEFAGKQQKLSIFLQNTEKFQNNEEGFQNSKRQKIDKQNKQQSITQFLLQNSKKEKCVNDKIDRINHYSNSDSSTCQQSKMSEQEPNYNINKVKSDNENIKANADDRKVLNNKQREIWKNILHGPPESPLCKGHKEPCILRTVKKAGPNFGKQFFTCARPNGHPSNPEAHLYFH